MSNSAKMSAPLQLSKASVEEQATAWNEYVSARIELDEGYTYERRERARIAFNRFVAVFIDGPAGTWPHIRQDSDWGMPK